MNSNRYFSSFIVFFLSRTCLNEWLCVFFYYFKFVSDSVGSRPFYFVSFYLALAHARTIVINRCYFSLTLWTLLFWICLQSICSLGGKIFLALLVPIEWISEILINHFCGGLDDCRQSPVFVSIVERVFDSFGLAGIVFVSLSAHEFICVCVSVPFYVLFCFSIPFHWLR